MASEDRRTKPTLFSLPSELRNQIFTLAVVESSPLLAQVRGNFRTKHAHPLPPTLARASRQARYETLPIFYGTNIFRFPESLVQYWLNILSARIPGANEYLKRILLNPCDCAFWVKKLSSPLLGMELTSDGIHMVSIYHLCAYTHNTCTCAVEATAREAISLPGMSSVNPLVAFVAKLRRSSGGRTCYYHGLEPKQRTRSCKCAKVERSMSGISAAVVQDMWEP